MFLSRTLPIFSFASSSARWNPTSCVYISLPSYHSSIFMFWYVTLVYLMCSSPLRNFSGTQSLPPLIPISYFRPFHVICTFRRPLRPRCVHCRLTISEVRHFRSAIHHTFSIHECFPISYCHLRLSYFFFRFYSLCLLIKKCSPPILSYTIFIKYVLHTHAPFPPLRP